jgi:hypothetical protein
MKHAALEVADAWDAESGSLGELFLREAGSDSVAFDQQTECRDWRWFHVESPSRCAIPHEARVCTELLMGHGISVTLPFYESHYHFTSGFIWCSARASPMIGMPAMSCRHASFIPDEDESPAAADCAAPASGEKA